MIWPSGEYGHPDEARSIALEATDYAVHKVEPQIISKLKRHPQKKSNLEKLLSNNQADWQLIVQPTKQFALPSEQAIERA